MQEDIKNIDSVIDVKLAIFENQFRPEIDSVRKFFENSFKNAEKARLRLEKTIESLQNQLVQKSGENRNASQAISKIKETILDLEEDIARDRNNMNLVTKAVSLRISEKLYSPRAV